jgi:hypothetical protein
MRLRYATLKTEAPYSREIVEAFLDSLPSNAIAYNHEEWPRICLIYTGDKREREAN